MFVYSNHCCRVGHGPGLYGPPLLAHFVDEFRKVRDAEKDQSLKSGQGLTRYEMLFGG